MNLQNIAFVFENLEHIIVPANQVEHIYMLDLKDNLTFNDGSPIVHQDKSAEHVFIQLKTTADGPSNDAEHHSKAFSLFDRLINQKDVTMISLNMNTDHQKDIDIYWSEESGDYSNPSQTARISPDGELFFVVSNGQTVDDYLPKELDE